MAETITFRPKPGVAAALDALRDAGNRSFHINAALTEYLGLSGEDGEGGNGVVEAPAPSGDDEPQTGVRTTRSRPRRARQAVPVPAGEAPPCPHPKGAIKKLPYGNQCTECGQMLH